MPTDRLANLLESLREHELLEPVQLDELSVLPEAQDPDPRALARTILKRDWLTSYQLNQILQGRSKDLQVGPYRLLDRLGEGGMGQVFRAHHGPMNRIVALKIIRKEKLVNADSVKRFYQEVQAAAQLVHPNIVLAYDAGQAGAIHYFAMEYIDGTDLSRLVKNGGPLPVDQACEYVRQAAVGLQHAHERGLVHRDIKPANLLLAKSAAQGAAPATQPPQPALVKILDMGLARLQTGGDKERALTQVGAVLGTPDYLAPEQALSSRLADIRSDLYSLGCTFFYLLTGQPPFRGTSFTDLLLKHQAEDPPMLGSLRPGVPARLQGIVTRLLAKKPGDRFQTPAELAAALVPLCRGANITGAAPVPIRRKSVRPPTPAPATAVRGGDTDSIPASLTNTVESPPTDVCVVTATPPEKVPRRTTSRMLLGLAAGLLLTLTVAGGIVFVLVVRGNIQVPLRAAVAPAVAPGLPRGEEPGASTRQPDPRSPDDPVKKTDPVPPHDPKPLDDVAKPDPVPTTDTKTADKPAKPDLVPPTDTKTTDKPAKPDPVPPTDTKTSDKPAKPDPVPTTDTKTADKPAKPDPVQPTDTKTTDKAKPDPVPSTDTKTTVKPAKPDPVPPTDTKTTDKPAKPDPVPPTDTKTADKPAKPDPVPSTDTKTTDKPAKPDPVPPTDTKTTDTVAKLPPVKPGPTTLKPDKTAPRPDVMKALRSFPGHTTVVRCVAFSPDGRYAASGGGDLKVKADCVIRLWDLKSGKALPPCDLKDHGLYSLAFSPNGKFLVSGDDFTEVRLWEVASGRERGKFINTKQPGTAYAVKAVTFLPDGRYVLGTGDGRNARLWDVTTGKIVFSFEGFADELTCAAVSTDGRRALVTGVDRTMRLYDLRNGQLLRRSEPQPEAVSCAVFSPDNRWVLSGTTSGSVCLWSAATAKDVHHCDQHSGPILALAFTSDSHRFLSASADKTVRVWDADSGQLLQTFTGIEADKPAISMAFAPDRQSLLVGCQDASVTLYELPRIDKPSGKRAVAKERQPVPDRYDQAKAERSIKEVYKEEFAKRKPNDMQDLAGKLIRQAAAGSADAATRYVLLREARDAAAQGLDPTLVIEAIDALAADYAVDGTEMKLTTLAAVARGRSTPASNKALADACLTLGDDLAAADKYDLAARALDLAEAAARKSNSSATLAQVSGHAKTVREQQKEYGRVKESFETLQGEPEDAEANLAVGRFLCLFKGDWDKGLPLLAKGHDGPLPGQARKELNNATEVNAILELADGWWDLGEKEKGAAKSQLQKHACSGYRTVLPQLTGLNLTKAEKRLKQAGE